MNYLFGVVLLLTANSMLVEPALVSRDVFRKPPIWNQVVLPPVLPVNITLPGTKWCGVGHIAANFSELGTFDQTDMCCRAHQHCEEIIEPIGSLHSLENPTLLPRFHCECEQKLWKCLRGLDDIPSKVYGEAYFTLTEKCFAKDFPAVECAKYQSGALGLGKRCVIYTFDESKHQKYQYFDMPFYSTPVE